MTDLDRFVDLYRSLRIEPKILKFNGFGEPLLGSRIVLSDNNIHPDGATTSEKFDGYCGFYTEIEFDENDKFVKQGFWE